MQKDSRYVSEIKKQEKGSSLRYWNTGSPAPSFWSRNGLHGNTSSMKGLRGICTSVRCDDTLTYQYCPETICIWQSAALVLPEEILKVNKSRKVMVCIMKPMVSPTRSRFKGSSSVESLLGSTLKNYKSFIKQFDKVIFLLVLYQEARLSCGLNLSVPILTVQPWMAFGLLVQGCLEWKNSQLCFLLVRCSNSNCLQIHCKSCDPFSEDLEL